MVIYGFPYMYIYTDIGVQQPDRIDFMVPNFFCPLRPY